MSAVVSLGHIKEKRADGREPWDEVPAEPVKRRRIAWPGGKITSNKDEALVAYLSKKVERGEALTDVQRAAFDKATKGTRFEGKEVAEAMQFAAEERKTAAPAAPAAPAPKADAPSKKGRKGKGKGGGRANGNAKGGRGGGRGGGGGGRGATGKANAKKRGAVGAGAAAKSSTAALTKRIDGGLSVGR